MAILFVAFWILAAVTLASPFVAVPIWLVVMGRRALRRRRARDGDWWALRPSEHERTNAAALLGDAYAEGRISTAELERRAQTVWEAREREDLRVALGALPVPRPQRRSVAAVYEGAAGIALLALAQPTPWRLLGGVLLAAALVTHDRGQLVPPIRVGLAFLAGLAVLGLSPWAAILLAPAVLARR